MVNDDEFMLVRKKDNSVILARIFLTEKGIATTPFGAENGENANLAYIVNSNLESEISKRVSFGKIG
jgi:hypothetical protein